MVAAPSVRAALERSKTQTSVVYFPLPHWQFKGKMDVSIKLLSWLFLFSIIAGALAQNQGKNDFQARESIYRCCFPVIHL